METLETMRSGFVLIEGSEPEPLSPPYVQTCKKASSSLGFSADCMQVSTSHVGHLYFPLAQVERAWLELCEFSSPCLGLL